MGDKVWVQCQQCGFLYNDEIHDLSEDDLYIKKYCPHCRDETKHLWCGKNKEDTYIYYNLNTDPRYY